MSNKFLEKYPKLREPRIGDTAIIIKILGSIYPYYVVGRKCKIVEIKTNNYSYIGDFNYFYDIESPFMGKCNIGFYMKNFILYVK